MFAITPLTGTLGARVDSLDLSEPLSDEAVEKLSAALDEHKVLVFRDQDAVGPKELEQFAERFGVAERTDHPVLGGTGDAVKIIESDAADPSIAGDFWWHTDGSTRENTAWVSVLQSVDVPPYGRDTIWADMEAIFASLSAPVQQFLEARTALHSWGAQKPDAPPVEHPAVRTNTRTGRKSLYINQLYTRSIVGLNAAESELLLKYLIGLPLVPEMQVRVSWDPGTIVMWDNESTVHYGVREHPYPRIQRRVMVQRQA